MPTGLLPPCRRPMRGFAGVLALLTAACTAPSYYDASDRAALRESSVTSVTDTQETSGVSDDSAEAGTATPRPPTPPTADKVVVVKSKRELRLMDDGDVFASYPVALGSNPVGDKRKAGDGRTPEGRYTLDWRNPESEFHRALHISYPSERDRRRAEQAGVDPGDNIMIHGLPPKYAWMGETHAKTDWTDGCIAVTNAEMDRIWKRVDDGTPIVIYP